MTYIRVIPRDLFNEAKLLKCVGRLCLKIHDGEALNNMKFHHDGDPFRIEQNQSDGGLYIRNVSFSIKAKQVFTQSAYNSKREYPLMFVSDEIEDFIFDNDGSYTQEFIKFCNSL